MGHLKSDSEAATMVENSSWTSHRGWELNTKFNSLGVTRQVQIIRSTCQSGIIRRMKADAMVQEAEMELKSGFSCQWQTMK